MATYAISYGKYFRFVSRLGLYNVDISDHSSQTDYPPQEHHPPSHTTGKYWIICIFQTNQTDNFGQDVKVIFG